MAAGQKGAGQGTGSKDQDALTAFAEELKAWRAARGWTQGELGAEATHPNVTEDQVAERLAARISRQGILARSKPPRVWLLLYQPVLCNLVGSPQTMYDQILRVVGASRRPNITVQVLPTGLHAALKGSFHIAENVGVAGAAYMEDVMDGRTTQNPETLNELSERFRYLQIEAMNPSASRDFMEKVAKETWIET